MFNRKLLDENNQLKNLTRTLLSHPAFQTFLEDMSRNQTFLAGPAPTHMQMPATMDTQPSQPQNEIKQEPEQDSQQQYSQQPDQTQVNMAHMPDSSLDMSMLNLGKNHWGQQTNGFHFQQPSVFAVFDIPQGPCMEEIRCSRLPLANDLAGPVGDETGTTETQDQASSSERKDVSATATAFDYSFASLNRQLERSLSKAQLLSGSQLNNSIGSSSSANSDTLITTRSTAWSGRLHSVPSRHVVQ